MKRLLLTGGAGELGRVLIDGLAGAGHEIIVADVAPYPHPLPASAVYKQLDVLSPELFSVVREQDMILHFAGVRSEGPVQTILETNVLGSIRILEAARLFGCRAIIASSNHVVGQSRRDESLSTSELPRPDSFYGWGKAAVELAGRLYFDKHGVENAHLRIGSCLAVPTEARHLATWLSHNDLTRLVTACINVEVLGYAVIWGISNNARRRWLHDDASEVGYYPLDNAEDFAAELAKQDNLEESAEFQGGAMAERPLPTMSVGAFSDHRGSPPPGVISRAE